MSWFSYSLLLDATIYNKAKFEFQNKEVHKVCLHVYDLSQGLAKQVSLSLLGKAIEGIWHTGVVVYGTEYYFGGGIYRAPVGTAPYGTPVRMIELGDTKVSKDEFESFLEKISPRFTHETYSLLHHNCNNFSNEVAQFLVNTTIPQYILDLPNEVSSSPLAPLMMPMIQSMEATLREGDVPTVCQFAQPLGATSSEGGKGEGSDDQKVCLQPLVDPQGNARGQVHDEIAKEFAAIRAQGTYSPSEAAALATKNVMMRYGFLNPAPAPTDGAPKDEAPKNG
ncbi:hypothetical protein OSB04_020558 [Centaurea solstitialis]|uniref:PPPDE domain-containing protein n=1 Tax=Centaurea solstitialis TaxID=347529 RepID=A0AA38WDD8_9ASTR|nr:hypothetical protein OSB04_020558 [Centaurea solstitialis]